MLLAQKPSTTEAQSHGVFPYYSLCFRVSVVQESMQGVFDQDTIRGFFGFEATIPGKGAFYVRLAIPSLHSSPLHAP
jgi:hypothetical protein